MAAKNAAIVLAGNGLACSMASRAKLTTGKWVALAACSSDTALRDIAELVQRGVLRRFEAGGRSTRDEIVAGNG